MRRASAGGVACGVLLALLAARPVAHKPITSPYTFNDDIFPIVQTHCGRCHVAGGVAPMALLTHADTVPWGESIRAELLSGHMPPWSVDSSRDRVRHAPGLTARELNMLLTWAAGGTPSGAPERAPAATAIDNRWPLGPPDMVLPLPAGYEMTADEQEATVEFTVATAAAEARLVRAIDLLPGNPALVRDAMILLKGASVPVRTAGDGAAAAQPEDVLSLWVPGDTPVPADPYAAFVLPAGAELLVRVHYKKTWEYEREVMRDRSLVGLYFAASPLPEIRSLTLAPAAGTDAVTSLAFPTTIDEDLRALAIYPDPALTSVRVIVTAQRPDGSREEIIAFRPRAGWARRYWFTEPIALPRGTVISTVAHGGDVLRPPGAPPNDDPPPAPDDIRLTLNVVRAQP